MEIVLSGLDENACHELVGDALWDRDSVGWLAPDRFLDPAVWQADKTSGKRFVWFYRSPIAVASETGIDGAQEDPKTVLDTWLRCNRAALNLRRLAGHRLLVINADRALVADLRAELGGGATHQDDIRKPAAIGHADPALTDVLTHLFEWAGPRYCEVFQALEASSWPQHDEPVFGANIVADEAQLIAMLGMLHRPAETPGRQSSHEQLQCEKDRLQLQLHQLQEELEHRFLESKKAASQEEAQATRQHAHDVVLENDLLQVQLQQVRDELEAHYLSNVELRKQLEGEARAHAGSKEKINALRLQLQQMHKELQRMAQAHAEAQAGSLAPRSRFSRFVPGRIRMKRERAQSERQLQARIDAIGQSEWFDRQWYLETYPDVKVADMDPVRHYVEFGWKEDRNPGPGFDTSYYLMSNVDVARSGLNPLLHFIEHGREEGRVPCEP